MLWIFVGSPARPQGQFVSLGSPPASAACMFKEFRLIRLLQFTAKAQADRMHQRDVRTHLCAR